MNNYKILSFTTIFPMIISFKEVREEQDVNEDTESIAISTSVKVDYFNKKVHFDEQEKLSELGHDLELLESKILDSLVPQNIENPEIPKEILDRISQVKSGSYESFSKI
jgi:hypothetical protein